MTQPVAILGAGPAGLMAAHAFALEGIPVVVLSQPDTDGKVKKSRLGGAQFLHEPIPMINDDMEPVEVKYQYRGSVMSYRAKVYGDNSNVPFVSMEGVYDGKTQQAWNLGATYERLWNLLGGDSANAEVINPTFLAKALEKEWFSQIISSVPAQAICKSYADEAWEGPPHAFVSQKVLIRNECILEDLPDNTIFYNGDLSQSWYRCSRLYGLGSTEWSSLSPRPPQPNLIEGRKPLRTNCDCFKDDVLRVGRFGTWTKGVLTHHAFRAAQIAARLSKAESE